MKDGQIINALMLEIENQLAIYGILPADLHVTRSNQPSSQYSGATSSTKKYQVFLTPVVSTQIGSGSDRQGDKINYQHVKAKSYQISCLVDFDYADVEAIPAHDLAQIINDMLQQRDAARNLRTKGVQVQECSNVRPTFSVNNSDNYESEPSFDITIIYQSSYTKEIETIEETVNPLIGIV